MSKHLISLPDGESDTDECHSFASRFRRGFVRDNRRSQAHVALGQSADDPGKDEHGEGSRRGPDPVGDRDPERAQQEEWTTAV